MSITGRDEAYEKIKNLLNTGELKAGDVTSVNELIEKLNMSRSPVRDAILRLNDEGIVQVIPRKGIFVSGVFSKDIKDLFQLRLAIELFAVDKIIDYAHYDSLKELDEIIALQEESAKKGDNESFLSHDEYFHIKMVEILNNERMNKIIQNSREQLALYGFKSLTFHANAIESVDEHKKILEAIKQKDRKTARYMLTKHLTRTKNLVLLE